MAAGQSPMSAMLAQKLMERLAAKGTPGGGAAGVSTPDAGGQQLQQQYQGLSGADPEAAMKAVKAMNSALSRIYVQLVTQVPDAAQHIANAQKALNKANELISKAAATLNAVRPQIANSASLPPGSMPQPGGDGGGGGEGGL